MLTSIELTEVFSLDAAKSDSVDLPNGAIRAISANTAGNIAYVTTGGTEGLLAAVAGVIYYLRIARLKSTSTTATGIYGYR